MAASPKKPGSKANVIVWALLAVLVLAAGVLALNVSQRFRRVVQETNQVRTVVQEAISRQETLVTAPARKEFSPAFLQMAFGDNPVLLERIKDALTKALGEKPALAQGDIAMMLVTYRAEGELRDVAIHIFGNLTPERQPRFSKEGYWRGQLPEDFYDLGQALVALGGRELVILAEPDVERRQRELIDAGYNNRYPFIENYLTDPVSFIAVVPEPGMLFTDRFRPYMAATLIKGKVSLDEARMELVALSFDARRAQELAQLLSDVRLMAVALARMRYGSAPAEVALQRLTRAQIQVEGPTVIVRTAFPRMVVERALPRLLRAVSRGATRIHGTPDFPG